MTGPKGSADEAFATAIRIFGASDAPTLLVDPDLSLTARVGALLKGDRALLARLQAEDRRAYAEREGNSLIAGRRKGASTNADQAQIRKYFWRLHASDQLNRGYRRSLDELAQQTVDFCRDKAQLILSDPVIRCVLKSDGKPYEKATIKAALKGVKRAERKRKGKTS